MRREVGQFADLPNGTVHLHVKNGRQRLVVLRTVQVRDDAKAVEGLVATIKDITEEPQPAVPGIIAESRAMQDVLGFVRRVAASEASSILIEGENGTIKPRG